MSVIEVLPSFYDVDGELEMLGFAAHTSEVHGAMCGYIAALGDQSFASWYAEILLQLDNRDIAEGIELSSTEVVLEEMPLLEKLFKVSTSQLNDSDYAFHLLLPDDEESLEERLEALAEWCDGFLFGITAGRSLDFSQLSTEAREVVSDFVQISRAGLSEDHDAEEDEVAFEEIVEYVRIGVLLLKAEVRNITGQGEKVVLH